MPPADLPDHADPHRDAPRHSHPFALLELTRPLNVVLSMVGAYVGALTTGLVAPTAGMGLWADIVLLLIAAGLGTAGGNALNDLNDLPVDRTAHPHRPLPSGRATRRGARNVILFSWAIAVPAAFLAAPHAGILAAIDVGLLSWYELRFKKMGLPGNLAVAAVAGSLFPLGALAVGAAGAALVIPLVLGLLAATAHLGRELLKDAEDAAADRAVRRTFAVRHGPRAAGRLAAAVLLAAVALSTLPYLMGHWGTTYLGVVAMADLLFLGAAVTGLGAPGRGRRLAKVAMVVALAAFLTGIATA